MPIAFSDNWQLTLAADWSCRMGTAGFWKARIPAMARIAFLTS